MLLNLCFYKYFFSILSDGNGIPTHNHLVRKWALKHLAKLVRLNGWVFVYKLSGCGFDAVAVIKLRIWHLLRARSSLTFRQSIECEFTLKRVRDMIITGSNFEDMFLKINFQTYYISTELLTVTKPSIIYQYSK